ncbi:FAD-dependent oxidoreductase [Pseudomaricurvus alkylphenolicus]|jgi:3-phenylpropionate/trans-cinnamate dioxygenase ferredoxin reductase subunit|uniref:NAD(P)/FAD-dependent oxidoreductase n=1 Tax=Pseudomaricurvus alkylphenolicus TaxID=1306991 RepID=UPI00141F865B|nr:FAD-dependent oxidoreductase [Pseudomaricurvus alkylphenolicus]NIB43923.1 FAD-dependent oxidoreductase [Pseudomaricurvus alkylphenolicus]
MSKTCIIIGASHAAAQLAPSLRQEGWDGKIIVLGDEPYLPYHRPPLSKAFLAGDTTPEKLLIRNQAIYEKNDIEFKLGVRVESIDRSHKTLTLDNGEVMSYDKLALCTGSRVRTVSLPGVELGGIHYLRDISDVEKIKEDVAEGANAVIVGGGYIGLETAASLKKQGMNVTVLEMAPRVLARVTAPELSEFYTRVHSDEGVSIKTGVAVAGFEGDGKVQRVTCADGTHFDADLVVIGVGIVPNVELAEAAGLEVENGVVVDQYARTNDPDIVAAGDVTNHPNALYDIRLRLESVPNATDQAKSAAASICGNEKVYSSLPWFWSDQYDLKLQIAGLSQGYDEVIIRGDKDGSRSFVAFYLKEGKLISADCVNRPQEFMVSKKLIAENISVDPAKLADESIAPKELLAG